MGVSGGQTWQHNQQQSSSNTQFPAQFLKQFQDVFGPGFGVPELIAALPKTSGLFGGQAGLFGTQPTAAAPSSPTTGADAGSAGGASSLGMGAPGAPGQQGPAPRKFTVDEILAAAGTDPYAQQATNVTLQKLGGAAAGPFTIDQLRAANEDQMIKGQSRFGPVLATLGGQQGVSQQMPTDPRFTSPAPTVGVNAGLNGGINGAVSALGFGNAAPVAQVQNIRDAPTINAAQVDLSKQIPDYQNALFQSQFQPVARELNRQGGIQQQNLAADLANRGLAGSGTGVGQQQRAQREVNQQVQFAAEDAANRSSVQRFQMEYNQALANAGFNMQAQIENAHNVLTGDVAKADNYLKTIGLNADNAAKQKDSFLKLLGIQQQDLARMDQFQLGVTDRLLNTWLQTFGAVAGAGQTSTGESTGHTHDFNQSVGISAGGAGASSSAA